MIVGAAEMVKVTVADAEVKSVVLAPVAVIEQVPAEV